MIDFYKRADKKRRGELDFVPDRVEEKLMLLLFPKKNKAVKPRQSAPAVKNAAGNAPTAPRRAFFDAYYECV